MTNDKSLTCGFRKGRKAPFVGWFGGVKPLHFGVAERARKGSMTHCAIDPFLALVAAKEAHQIGARIYSATTTEYIRDV